MTYTAEPARDDSVDLDFSDNRQNSKHDGPLRGAE